MRRREAFAVGAAALTGAVVAGAASIEAEDYSKRHPTVRERVSPLVGASTDFTPSIRVVRRVPTTARQAEVRGRALR